MAKLKFYNSFDDSRPPEVTVFEKSKTIQSHAIGLSVKEIIERFAITGTIPQQTVPGQFMDTTILPNMFSALNMRVQLDQYFASLKPSLRFEFENDPMKLVAFINDPKNFNSAVEKGLLNLTPEGERAKKAFDDSQAKKKADERQAFVADISQIVKNSSAPPTT